MPRKKKEETVGETAENKTASKAVLKIKSKNLEVSMPETGLVLDKLFAGKLQEWGDAKNKKRDENLKLHMEAIVENRHRRGDDEPISIDNLSARDMENFETAMKEAADIDPKYEPEISAIWQDIIDGSINGASDTEKLIKLMKEGDKETIMKFIITMSDDKCRNYIIKNHLEMSEIWKFRNLDKFSGSLLKMNSKTQVQKFISTDLISDHYYEYILKLKILPILMTFSLVFLFYFKKFEFIHILYKEYFYYYIVNSVEYFEIFLFFTLITSIFLFYINRIRYSISPLGLKLYASYKKYRS